MEILTAAPGRDPAETACDRPETSRRLIAAPFGPSEERFAPGRLQPGGDDRLGVACLTTCPILGVVAGFYVVFSGAVGSMSMSISASAVRNEVVGEKPAHHEPGRGGEDDALHAVRSQW